MGVKPGCAMKQTLFFVLFCFLFVCLFVCLLFFFFSAYIEEVLYWLQDQVHYENLSMQYSEK